MEDEEDEELGSASEEEEEEETHLGLVWLEKHLSGGQRRSGLLSDLNVRWRPYHRFN